MTTSSGTESQRLGLTPWRMRLASGTVLAGAGIVGTFALLQSIQPDQTPLEATLRLAASALALMGALLGLIELHGVRLEDAARGRVAGPSSGGAIWRAAGGLACLILAAALVVSTAAELAVLAAQTRSEEDTGGGSLNMRALDQARARAAAYEGLPGEDQTPRSLVAPDPTGRRRQAVLDDGPDRGHSLGNLLSDDVMLEVIDLRRSWPDPERPVHLRGFVVDSFDRLGVLRERAGARIKAVSGPGGWIQASFEDPASRGAEPLDRREVELEIRSAGPRLELVFGPHPISSVLAPSWELDQLSMARYLRPSDIHGTLRVRSKVLLDLDHSTAAQLVSRGSLPDTHRTLALPRPATRRRSFALASARLDALAADLARGARHDMDRALAVVEHLRTSFAYELYDVDFLDTEGCVKLIDRGAGSCTHFASLAVHLLRRLGLPARIAAGYVARERLPGEVAGWTVRQRDGHAWVEVHFAGEGWLTFDPTPGDATIGGALRNWSPLAEKTKGPGSRRALTSPLARLGVDGARALLRVLPLAWLPVGVMALLLALALVRPRRSGETVTGPVQPAPSRPAALADPGVAAVMAALDERGWGPRLAETPRAHAARIERQQEAARGLESFMLEVLVDACSPSPTVPSQDRVQRGLKLAGLLRERGGTRPSAPPSR